MPVKPVHVVTEYDVDVIEGAVAEGVELLFMQAGILMIDLQQLDIRIALQGSPGAGSGRLGNMHEIDGRSRRMGPRIITVIAALNHTAIDRDLDQDGAELADQMFAGFEIDVPAARVRPVGRDGNIGSLTGIDITKRLSIDKNGK